MALGDKKSGWDFPSSDNGGNGSRGSGFNGKKTWGFSIPRPKDDTNPFGDKAATKRVLFLSDSPLQLWMHPTYRIPGAEGLRDVLCLHKNGLDDRGCPMDVVENVKLQYTGWFLVIDMGFVQFNADGNGKMRLLPTKGKKTDENGNVREYQFEKRALPAKKGGIDKPGVLITLKQEMTELGLKGLAGTVWHTRRDGGLTESVGNTWKNVNPMDENGRVKVLKPEEYVDYLKRWGADPSNLDLDPIDWDEHFSNSPDYDELAKRFGGTQSEQNTSKKAEGADWARGSESSGSQKQLPNDDDIPF